MLAACSGSLNTSDPGTAGTGSGTAGVIGNDCGLTGAGNCIGTGGTGGGGTGGSAPLPACTVDIPTFGVCFVNDAEAHPVTTDAHTSGAATIEAVGSGAAPVSCPSERVIGVSGGPSNWWFQARAADNRLWTIGVVGLAGSTPPVRRGDVVTLDLDWRAILIIQGSDSIGHLQLSDAAGTPLLWVGASNSASPADPTWISFAAGDYVCGSGDTFCDMRQRNVIATINGSSMTLPPYGAASLDGYALQVTNFAALCGDYASAFKAAAVKASPVTTP